MGTLFALPDEATGNYAAADWKRGAFSATVRTNDLSRQQSRIQSVITRMKARTIGDVHLIPGFYDQSLTQDLGIGERSESSVYERGLTHLVDAAVMLLGQVPKRSWRSIVDWPAKGDWSSRLRTAHTPEALQAAVEMAMARVVRWPEAKSRAVRIRLSGYAGSHGELICNDQPLPNGASMIAACCFACGHKNALGQHPRIPCLRCVCAALREVRLGSR